TSGVVTAAFAASSGRTAATAAAAARGAAGATSTSGAGRAGDNTRAAGECATVARLVFCRIGGAAVDRRYGAMVALVVRRIHLANAVRDVAGTIGYLEEDFVDAAIAVAPSLV